MKSINLCSLSVLVLLSTFFLQACSNRGCTDSEADNYNSAAKKDDGSCVYDSKDSMTVVLKIKHLVKKEQLTLESKFYKNYLGQRYKVSNLKYIFSNIYIKHRNTGQSNSQNQQVEDGRFNGAYYFDAADPNTLEITLGKIQAGDYTGLGFTWGLTPSENVSSAFRSGPALDMAWSDSLGGGYHFMKMEGAYEPNNQQGTFYPYQLHLGNLSINGDMQENWFDVGPIYPYSVINNSTSKVNKLIFELEVDINWWLESPRNYDFSSYTYTRADKSAQETLRENGKKYVFELSTLIKE